jgi:uncharacterized OB-fold protein
MEHLKKKEFRVPICRACKKKVWPPFSRCPICFCDSSMQRVHPVGVLLEFSNSHLDDDVSYGIVDMQGIFLLGSLHDSKISRGMKVIMFDCGVRRDGRIFYRFKMYDPPDKG